MSFFITISLKSGSEVIPLGQVHSLQPESPIDEQVALNEAEMRDLFQLGKILSTLRAQNDHLENILTAMDPDTTGMLSALAIKAAEESRLSQLDVEKAKDEIEIVKGNIKIQDAIFNAHRDALMKRKPEVTQARVNIVNSESNLSTQLEKASENVRTRYEALDALSSEELTDQMKAMEAQVSAAAAQQAPK